MLVKVPSLVDVYQLSENKGLVDRQWGYFLLETSRVKVSYAWSCDDLLVSLVSTCSLSKPCIDTIAQSVVFSRSCWLSFYLAFWHVSLRGWELIDSLLCCLKSNDLPLRSLWAREQNRSFWLCQNFTVILATLVATWSPLDRLSTFFAMGQRSMNCLVSRTIWQSASKCISGAGTGRYSCLTP